jgi:hypothetical protein
MLYFGYFFQIFLRVDNLSLGIPNNVISIYWLLISIIFVDSVFLFQIFPYPSPLFWCIWVCAYEAGTLPFEACPQSSFFQVYLVMFIDIPTLIVNLFFYL